MARKRYPPTDHREWLNRARGNLARAGNVAPEYFLEDLCFDAQQAAEKAIKAVFVHRGWTFPYTHDIMRLLILLGGNGIKVPKYVFRADDLTPFAVVSRYPGRAGPVTKRRYRTLVRIGENVVRWAERLTS